MILWGSISKKEGKKIVKIIIKKKIQKKFWTGKSGKSIFWTRERLTVLNKSDFKGKIIEGILSAKPLLVETKLVNVNNWFEHLA